MRRSRRSKSFRPNRESKMAASTAEGLFWDIGNYKKTVKRIDDGAVICDELLRMVNERAEIEAKYARKLTAWEEKWRKQIENGPFYATLKDGIKGVILEAQERAKIHMDCVGKLHNQVLESIKRWKSETYHKHFMGYWKETKEIDDEFAKAQKPWAEAFGKVQRAKRNYHSASKTYDNATQAVSAATKNENFPPEKIKKLEDVANKNENSMAKMRKKYEEKLKRIEPLNTSYEQEMIKIFDKCQSSEEKKLHFLRDMLVEFHKSINIADDLRLNELLKDQLQSAYNVNVKHDLAWWSENYGSDMPRNWPRFEEPGEASPSVSNDNDANEADPYNTYQVPRKVDSASPVISSPTNGINNPFAMENPGSRSDDEWDDLPPSGDIIGVPVRALYVYDAVEDDELSFKAGDIFTKLSEEDAQGWCRGRFNGKEGLYPANYVELV